MADLFFEDWHSIGKIAITTVTAFTALFIFVRISGKRTLAKLNAFDFIVSIALGSTLSDIMVAAVPMAEGTVVLLLIIILQYAFAWLARSSPKMEKLMNAVPHAVFYNNKFIDETMKKEAITKDEIYAAIRAAGINQINDVEAVIMEINGTMSVIKKTDENGPSSLDNLNIKFDY